MFVWGSVALDFGFGVEITLVLDFWIANRFVVYFEITFGYLWGWLLPFWFGFII